MRPKRQAAKQAQRRAPRRDKSGVGPLPTRGDEERGAQSEEIERDTDGQLTRSRSARTSEQLDDEDTPEDDNVVPRSGAHGGEIQSEEDLDSEER